MRQLLVRAPRGHAERIGKVVQEHDTSVMVTLTGQAEGDEVDFVVLEAPNRQVGPLVESLSEIEGLRLSMYPQGVLMLSPPVEEVPQQVREVTFRSPLEIFLGGLQSVGSWRGFLSYAAIAGVVVWIGLFTNTSYLLVAAMLIAPFAGPAMNGAIATARGDLNLLGRSLGRYLASLAVTIAVTGLMSLLFQQQVATAQMVSTSLISSTAVLLPLAAGIAGGINLGQSERSSLVSGAATGMLVAASLAPPAGVVGMAAAIGEWPMAMNGLFLLVLQLVGINVAASLTFRLIGLRPEGPRYQRGQGWVQKASLIASVAGVVALVVVQFNIRPDLNRATIAQRAEAITQETVNGSGSARLIEADARFTRADIPGQNSLLTVIYVQPTDQATRTPAEIEQFIADRVRTALEREFQDVTPLVTVTAIQEPADASAEPRLSPGGAAAGGR